MADRRETAQDGGTEAPRPSGVPSSREETMRARFAGRVVSTFALLGLSLGVLVAPATAQKAQAPGVTATEIKIGQTMPYSGPASAYGVIGKAELAFFKML